MTYVTQVEGIEGFTDNTNDETSNEEHNDQILTEWENNEK